jgi:hypothetical protein
MFKSGPLFYLTYDINDETTYDYAINTSDTGDTTTLSVSAKMRNNAN